MTKLVRGVALAATGFLVLGVAACGGTAPTSAPASAPAPDTTPAAASKPAPAPKPARAPAPPPTATPVANTTADPGPITEGDVLALVNGSPNFTRVIADAVATGSQVYCAMEYQTGTQRLVELDVWTPEVNALRYIVAMDFWRVPGSATIQSQNITSPSTVGGDACAVAPDGTVSMQ